jgi:ATP/ADP translocase/HEAT repeat protein
MAKNSIHKILSRFADVRPEEISTSVLMFFHFFLITSSAYIIKLVKISDFLEKLSSRRLPYAYLLTAILIGFFVTLNSRLLRVMKRHVYISLSLVFFITSLLIFWLFFTQGQNWLPVAYWNWISMVFWFWADIFLVTSVTQFWILINDIYNPRQAKRLVGFLVSGGLLGGVAGALLASLSKIVGTENLLLICPFMLVICLVIVNRVHRIIQKEKKEEVKPSEAQKKPKIGYGKSFGLLRKNRHLLLLTGIMAVAIIVTTLIDFQFNYFVEDAYPNKDARTAFLGIFFTVFLIFSNLLHVFSTNRILKNFGIRVALLVAPFFLLLLSGAIFIVPFALVYWALIIKGTDKSLAHSLNQSVREYKAKIFIDMFVNKFAKGIGALLILLFFSVLSFEIKYISIIAIAFILIWIILNLLITKEYVNIVKRNIEIKWQDADKLVAEKIDIDMTKLVFDTIESKKRSSVLYAMNLFDLVKKEKLSPKLKKIISYKSDAVRASSMDSLLDVDGEVLIPEAEDALDEESLDAQVKEIMSLNVYQELMKDHLDKIVGEEGKEEEVSRMEAAKVMGMMEPTHSVVHNLGKLLRDKSPEVVSYALESAGKLKKRELVPFIIQNLKNHSLKSAANKALAEYGVKVIGTLKDYLGDPSEDARLRKALPDILAQTGAQRAADVLALELRKESRDVESEIVSAMYKMRSEKPQIHFREQIVVPQIIREIKESYLILKEIHDLKTDKKKDFLAKDLENNLARSLKYVFELLSLIYPREDIIKAYQNITAGTKKAIDYSIELLDNIVKKEIMEVLLPLIEDIPFEDKVKKGRKMLKVLDRFELSEE